MAGIDEASARSVLAVMQERLARDPASALGLAAHPSAEDLRAAFLSLTKQYHPVRFGRMATDIQKLSNEVFLALRAAHDTVAKNLRKQTGPMPTAKPPLGAVPVAVSGPATARNLQVPRTPSRAPETADRLPANPAAKPVARPVGPQPAPRGSSPGSSPVRPVAAPALVTPRDESAVLDLLSRQQWDQARTALHQLSARDPSSKRIRALTAYARGREAQIEGRVDDARVELHDALDLDPELQAAKTALTELFTRRK